MAVAIDFDARIVPGSVPHGTVHARMSPTASRESLRTTDLPCLVLTGDPALRRRLSAAAELAGWDAGESPTAAATVRESCRRDYRLVVIDLVSAPGCDRACLEATAAEFAARPDTLLVVCGAVEDRAQEIWARSLGAFAFVPGVAPGDSLISVFRDARLVARRQRSPAVATGTAPCMAGARG